MYSSLYKYAVIIISCAFISVVLTACECVTAIDTDREIKPDQFANVMFVNSNADFDLLKFKTETANFVINSYYEAVEYKYQDIIPGIVNINITSMLDSVVFNSIMDLKKAWPYTFFAFGNIDRVQGMLLSDTISNYTANNSYFRCVNLANETPYILFKIVGSYSIPNIRPFKTASDFFPTYSGNYNIEIRNATTDSLMLSINNQEFEPGVAYSLLLRGNFRGIGKHRIDLQVIKSRFLLDINKK